MSRSRAGSEFKKATMVDAFARCGGQCEAVTNGVRCVVKLRRGHWQCDHIIPVSHGGKPTLDNAQCLCTAHHSEKSKGDTTVAAKIKRNTATHIGAAPTPVKPIQNKGFSHTSSKRDEHHTPMPERRGGISLRYVEDRQ